MRQSRPPSGRKGAIRKAQSPSIQAPSCSLGSRWQIPPGKASSKRCRTVVALPAQGSDPRRHLVATVTRLVCFTSFLSPFPAECRDTTRYCEKVKQLKLCQLSSSNLAAVEPVPKHEDRNEARTLPWPHRGLMQPAWTELKLSSFYLFVPLPPTHTHPLRPPSLPPPQIEAPSMSALSWLEDRMRGQDKDGGLRRLQSRTGQTAEPPGQPAPSTLVPERPRKRPT